MTVVRRLEKACGKRPWRLWGKPLDSLVGTVLSQNTNDRNSDAAMERLQRALPDWNRAADAPLSTIAAAIRPAGLHRQKARSIRAILRRIRAERGYSLGHGRMRSCKGEACLARQAPTIVRARHASPLQNGGRSGGISLDFLRRWPTDRIKEYLLDLPGVGPKTAACVLLFSLRRPVLPVDTHVHRVTRRLGLIGPRTTAEQAHEVLAGAVPPQKVYAFHVLLIEHGRKVCHARRPACGECALNDICPSAFTFPPPRRPQARPMRPPRIARERTRKGEP